jgi:hypothetical protein
MAGTITGDCSKLEVASAQRGDPWTEAVISDRLADVELIDLHPCSSYLSIAM